MYCKEINALARAVDILDKKIEGTALPEDRLDLEVLRGIYGRVQAIRDAEGRAQAVLRGAKSVEEVEEVTPAWPEDDYRLPAPSGARFHPFRPRGGYEYQ